MKGELLKRFFRAIASSDQEAIDKLTYLVIEEERSKGHTLLADQLENITKKKPTNQKTTFSLLACPVNLKRGHEARSAKKKNPYFPY
jgi:hypothetical protein